MTTLINHSTFESCTGKTKEQTTLEYNIWDAEDFHKDGHINYVSIYNICKKLEDLITNNMTDGLISVHIVISRKVAREMKKLKSRS